MKEINDKDLAYVLGGGKAINTLGGAGAGVLTGLKICGATPWVAVCAVGLGIAGGVLGYNGISWP